MTLPDFLILGAQKAGSTWMYDCLKQHPEVYMPKAVELLHFNKPDHAQPERREAYESNFVEAQGFKRIGEKTPSYFWSTDRSRSLTQPPAGHNDNIPAAVKDTLGSEVDLIVSLRHPVWRAISAFGHHAKRNRIAPDRTLCDVAHTLGILDIGFYGAHLRSWLHHFERERFLVLIFEEDIVDQPQVGYQKLCDFLGVDADPCPPNLTKASNSGERQILDGGIAAAGHPSLIGPDDVSFLLDAYRDDIARTEEILGRELASWREETSRLVEWCASTLTPRSGSGADQGAEPPASKKLRRVLLGQDLQGSGLDTSTKNIAGLDHHFSFEPPARLSEAKVRGECSLGAFSYLVSGNVYNTHIGRYCSVAREVNIGQFNHTMDWLSTSPFQFQQGFVFNVGDAFPLRKQYEATKPDPQLSALARRQLTRTTVIGNDVWVGHGAVVIAGVRIGDGAVVGANTVVTKDVPPYAVVGGVPARVIRFRFDEPTRERLLRSAWWRFATWQLEGVPFQNVDAALDEIERRIDFEGMTPYEPGFISLEKG